MAKEEPTNVDYVEHGSERHAALLGLKKARKDDPLQMDGWTLMDMTAFGPQATDAYIREVLRQKVNELQAGAPPMPQSEDPLKPNYRPRMWVPADGAVTGIV